MAMAIALRFIPNPLKDLYEVFTKSFHIGNAVKNPVFYDGSCGNAFVVPGHG